MLPGSIKYCRISLKFHFLLEHKINRDNFFRPVNNDLKIFVKKRPHQCSCHVEKFEAKKKNWLCHVIPWWFYGRKKKLKTAPLRWNETLKSSVHKYVRMEKYDEIWRILLRSLQRLSAIRTTQWVYIPTQSAYRLYIHVQNLILGNENQIEETLSSGIFSPDAPTRLSRRKI